MQALNVLAALLGVALGAKVQKLPVELVLARQEGDIAWAAAHAANATVTVYNQGASLEPHKGVNVVELPAAGYESRAFLHHIVDHYDNLADKVVFMPGQKPGTGFQGFRHGTAHMLPGVDVKDYVSKSSPALFVPTMAVTSNMQQVSVRTAYMEGQPEAEDERFSVCSHEGSAGWSPFMPNTYASSVLEPLMAKQEAGEALSFEDFWSRHMPESDIPDVLRVAHGSIFSVTRKDIQQRPKSFYEKLLADVSDESRPHLPLFVESMWYYLFQGEKGQVCPEDLSSSTAVASKHGRRRLAQAILILDPKAGDKFKFGQVMKILWSTVYTANTVPFRVELWQYGEFQTWIKDETYSTSYEFMVSPAASIYGGNGEGYRSSDEGSGEAATRYNLVPGDRYTIRVCDGSADATQPFDERICDDTYSESGEFTLEPTLTMLEPACDAALTTGQDIQVVWSSYYLGQAPLTIALYTGDHFMLWSETLTSNTGYFNFWAPFDMPAGSYRFKVTADCSGCSGYGSTSMFMKGAYSAVTGTGCAFSLSTGTAASPPPASLAPSVPWEIPIIKAFESGYGGSVYTPNTGGDSFVISSHTGCEKVCMLGYGRKLLFGGLGYLSGAPSGGSLPCSAEARACACAFCR